MTRTNDSNARLWRVPRSTPDVIAYLLDQGERIRDLATVWAVTPDAVYRMRRGEFIPKATTTAAKIAKSIGWGVGEVIEHFAAKVQR